MLAGGSVKSPLLDAKIMLLSKSSNTYDLTLRFGAGGIGDEYDKPVMKIPRNAVMIFLIIFVCVSPNEAAITTEVSNCKTVDKYGVGLLNCREERGHDFARLRIVGFHVYVCTETCGYGNVLACSGGSTY